LGEVSDFDCNALLDCRTWPDPMIPAVLKRLDQPEIWLALQGFLVAFAWEMFQMPFYDMGQLSSWETTRSCAIASFGDAGIMVFSYTLGSLIGSDRHWINQQERASLAVYLLCGLVVTVAFEALALRSNWGWAYSQLMPTIAGIGLVPVAMWIIVPMAALGFAKRLSTTT